jgi:hydroxymethylpyrimidine/phosphomethylpyrimidine kinase
MKKILLSVAGLDPSSGAGILMDLKVFEQFNFQGVAVLTSLTVQNTIEVKKVHCLPPDFLWDQYKTLKADIPFSGIKVGMVGCDGNIEVIGKILSENKDIPRVVDPVFKSSSGTWLLEKESVQHYISEISKKASLLTPNLEEALLISGIKIRNVEDMKEAAKKIHSNTKIPCLIKGLNLKSAFLDLLYDGREFYKFEKEKIKKKVHGTGCFLSSCILCFLVKGRPLDEACSLATQCAHQAISKAIRLGSGQCIISFPLNEK